MMTKRKDKPCVECGGSGIAYCRTCNDTGIGPHGGDCYECATPKPCPACVPSDVRPAEGVET